MQYEIRKDLPEPAYIQLYRFLIRDIEAGIYPYGAKLPSKRVLAEETGVSLITAEHALTLLSEEGYVETRQRSGIYVTYRGEDFFSGAVPGRRDRTAPRDFSEAPVMDRPGLPAPAAPGDLPAQSDTGDFPFSVLTRTMRRVLSDYGERILVKSPNHGCPEFRSELCGYLARSRGISVKPSQVIVGSGAEYLYGLIVQLLGTDRIYGLENPSYRKIREVYEAMGASCELLNLTGNGIASQELKRTGARILHVTPFHSYPSGVTADISKKREYLRWAKNRGGILIEDNYDSELTVSRKPEEPLFSMDPEVDVLYLNTFSRTIAPSMRVGYLVLPEGLTKDFDEKLGFYSCTVPIFEQYVLAELLRSGDFERHVNRVRRNRRKQQ